MLASSRQFWGVERRRFSLHGFALTGQRSAAASCQERASMAPRSCQWKSLCVLRICSITSCKRRYPSACFSGYTLTRPSTEHFRNFTLIVVGSGTFLVCETGVLTAKCETKLDHGVIAVGSATCLVWKNRKAHRYVRIRTSDYCRCRSGIWEHTPRWALHESDEDLVGCRSQLDGGGSWAPV